MAQPANQVLLARKFQRVFLCLCVFILPLAVLPAWGNPWRGMNTNGVVHRVSAVTGSYVTIDIGLAKNGIFPNKGVTGSYITYQSTYSVCRPSNRMPGAGEGVAEFDNEIYYAYIAYTPSDPAGTSSCTHSGTGLSVWVARFDPGPARWVSNRALGSVSTINSGQGTGSGAALAVLSGQLYVFTDSHTYSSTNGDSWTGTYPPVYSNVNYEPLDAVTLYPAGGPAQVLIVFGRQSAAGNLYAELMSGVWDGDPLHTLTNVTSFSYAPTYGRVSLTMGTANSSQSPNWGYKGTTVQLLHTAKASSSTAAVVQHLEYVYKYNAGPTFWGDWSLDPAVYASSVQDLFVFPNFAIECFESNDNYAATQDLLQVIEINWKDSGGSVRETWFRSDALVPQNRDIPLNKCGDLGGTPTDTTADDPNNPSALEVRRHYWTLLGVVLGSPPFSLNGYTATADLKDFSKVVYGTDASNTVNTDYTMSHSLMLSAGGEIRSGAREIWQNKTTFGISYKGAFQWAHGNATTHTIKDFRTFGTSLSAYENFGRWGWGLFNGPTLVTQNFDLYAYDYDAATGSGTKLNQTLHTITQNSAAIQAEKFELSQPGGPNDDVPGLMTGMQSFSCSRDLNYWYRTVPFNWEQDTRWTTRLGELEIGTSQFKLPALACTAGSCNEPSYTYQHQDYTTTGTTQELTIYAGKSFSFGSQVNGVAFDVKAAYTGTFSYAHKETTGFGTQLSFILGVKECKAAGLDCANTLTVQPYWLLPKEGDEGATAPWIPTAYKNDRPWAVAWKIKNVTPLPSTGPFDCGAIAPALASSGLVASALDTSRGGTSLPPDRAWGRIVSGMGGGEGGEPYSHYDVQAGRLAWLDAGSEVRIPMTADQFDPAKGVSLEFQGSSWSSSSTNGSWIRSGEVWTFAPRGNVQEDRVDLKLDFGSATYDLHVNKANFSGALAGVTNATLILTVNQLYTFYSTLQHDIDIAWRWSQAPADAKTMHVTAVQGRYNSANASGKMDIAGTLPAVLPVFGDISVEVNDRAYVARLINIDGFQQAFEQGGTIKYAKEGVIVVVDFGKKTWSATFNGKAFSELLAPRVGTIRTRVSVGGATWFKEEHPVPDYSANLTLRQ